MTEHCSATSLLLDRWNAGEPNAFDHLFVHLEPELRDVARRAWWRERIRSHLTLSKTELLSELYLRLRKGRRGRSCAPVARKGPRDRDHFLRYCARALQNYLKDRARRRSSQKRDGGIRMPLDEFADFDSETKDGRRVRRCCPTDLVSPRPQVTLRVTLESALRELERLDRGQHAIALRHLAYGKTLSEIAGETGLSLTLVKKRWRIAKLFLTREIRGRSERDAA